MLRSSLLLAVAVLVGCRTTARDLSLRESSKAQAATASADTPATVSAVLRVRVRSVLAKIGVDAKGKAAPVFKAWVDGIGVPMDAVEELTLVGSRDGGICSARLVTTMGVDRQAVQKACKGLQVAFESDRGFTCSRGAAPALDERIQKQLRAVGTHDVVLWGDAIPLLAEMEGLAAGVKDGLRDGTLTIDLGEETEAAARLNFKDEASARKGAKIANSLLQMGRILALQMTSQIDLLEAFPGMAGDASSREEAALIAKQYGMLRNAEPALRACKAVPRGMQVPLYVRMQVPLKTLGEFVEMADDKSGKTGEQKRLPGLFFGPELKGETKEIARATPPALTPATPVAQATPVPPAPLPPAPMALPPQALPPVPPVPMTLPPPSSPVVRASAVVPQPAGTLTIANVHREAVSVYAIEATGLRHLKIVPAGEAVDVPATAGQRLAATFGRAPHCVNHVVAGTVGEVWLLRPAPVVSPSAR